MLDSTNWKAAELESSHGKHEPALAGPAEKCKTCPGTSSLTNQNRSFFATPPDPIFHVDFPAKNLASFISCLPVFSYLSH